MKAALFTGAGYAGPSVRGKWPVPVNVYSSAAAQDSMNWALEQFSMADDLGFDWVTVAEHHFSPFSLTPNPMVMAGALTQRIKRARIALLGPNIPIQNPVRVAEEFAMLDNLTGGRVVAGMLRGTSNEYVTYNINPAESRERFDEALQIIRRAWTEPQPFGWWGRHFEYRTISIWPRPVQQPHPPMYMSGSSPESAELAARNRVGLGFAVTSVPLASQSARLYRQVARETGWTPAEDDVIYRVGIHVAKTDQQAFDELQSGEPEGNTRLARANPVIDDVVAEAGYYGRDQQQQRGRVGQNRGAQFADRLENGQQLAGSPETVLAQICNIRRELGAGVLDLIFRGPGRDSTRRSIELFAEKVLPRVHELDLAASLERN
jgi:alkanesulfonate monooxygenase SsuD/methylene tetrahydromethanopterin reductase-like flavin-dependent oxidoreductase (luciferase family)